MLNERVSNKYHQYLVKWEGYEEPEWQDSHLLVDSKGEPFDKVKDYLEMKRKEKGLKAGKRKRARR